MQTRLFCRAARSVLLSSVCLCAGCGTTGLAWVAEGGSDSARQHVSAANASNFHGAVSGSIPATAEQDSPAPRPRLSHTVTLGEIDLVAPRAEAGPSNQPGVGSVNVYNYNQVNVVAPGVGYGGYGYSRYPPSFLPGRVTAEPVRSGTSGPLPGQNWPALADHGPSFPYAAAPASPWTRTQ